MRQPTKKDISAMFAELGRKGAAARNANLSHAEKRVLAQRAARTRWINMQNTTVKSS